MSISIEEMRKAFKQVLAEENKSWIQPVVFPPLAKELDVESSTATISIVDDLLVLKKDEGLKEGTTLKRYRELGYRFARSYPQWPGESEKIQQYLRQFAPTNKLNHHNFLKMLFNYGAERGLPNPMLKIKRPRVKEKPKETIWLEQVMSQVHTRDVITSLLKQKKNKRVKNSTLQTYEKHLRRFAKEFPRMPLEIDVILDYLEHFNGETGRYRRNQQDLLNMLYRHATRFLGMPKNPMAGLERPLVTKRPIKTISLDTAWLLNNTPETLAERVALDMLLGHGWRQVEVRRILSGDVVNIRDGLIFCRGKEREEWAPVLPEAEERLQELARGLSPSEYVFVSQRIYRGKREPLGEDGMSQLINRLYVRAGITGMTGHDLRRSFATLVNAASNAEFLAMRLLRDKIPGQSERYINFPLIQLAEALKRYSPLRLIGHNKTGSSTLAEPGGVSGGDVGELNSPSRRSCPEYTTSLVDSLISSS